MTEKKPYIKPELQVIIFEKNVFLEDSIEVDFGYLLGQGENDD